MFRESLEQKIRSLRKYLNKTENRFDYIGKGELQAEGIIPELIRKSVNVSQKDTLDHINIE